MKTHKDLDVWNRSIELVTRIYGVTQSFPESEKFGLVNQIRRASVSVASNIAEGAARSSKKEFAQFLYMALGSTSELETQLLISKNLGYLLKDSFDYLNDCLKNISKMLLGLIRFLKKN